MYRYMPPKSSVWGHSLRNMKPLREKFLLDKFLETAAAEYSFASGSVFYQPSMETLFNEQPARESRSHFESILGVTRRRGDRWGKRPLLLHGVAEKRREVLRR
jgi:hypothetical protein